RQWSVHVALDWSSLLSRRQAAYRGHPVSGVRIDPLLAIPTIWAPIITTPASREIGKTTKKASEVGGMTSANAIPHSGSTESSAMARTWLCNEWSGNGPRWDRRKRVR